MKMVRTADYSYQQPLIEKSFQNLMHSGRALLAACPGAGKTKMAIEVIRLFKARFPNSKCLVFAHGQTLLRQQWSDVFKKWAPELSVGVLHRAIDIDKIKDIDVLLAIPQTMLSLKKFPEIDLLVVDEAHHYCEADATKRIIDGLRSKYELRLTGTPSIYIGKSDWAIDGITIQELLDYGVLTDPVIELAEADYKFGLSDYFGNMNLRQKTRLLKAETENTLDNVLTKAIERVSGAKTWKDCISGLKKTMIICHNQNQARDVAAYFLKHDIEPILSISDVTDGAEEVERFKTDESCSVFIVVSRGTLGFDFDKLSALIDLGGSLNVNKLFQMLCRVVRKNLSDPTAPKLYLKIATPELAPLTHFVMSFVVALSDPEYYFSYSNKNTKRADVPVPASFQDAVRAASSGGGGSSPSGDRAFPPLPKLFTFNEIKEIRSGKLKVFARTNFAEVRKYIRRGNLPSLDWDKIYAICRRCKNREEFKRTHNTIYKAIFAHNLQYKLDEILPVKKPTEWTVKKAIDLSKGYRSKSHFRVAHHGAFKFLAKQNKLHLISFPKKKIRWDLKAIHVAAKKCKTRTEFQDRFCGGYEWLITNGLLAELNQHYGTRFVWTYETAMAEAKKFQMISHFKEDQSGAYGFLIANGYYSKLVSLYRKKVAA